jgi:chemotaxis methyl-accepting protein methylase
MLKKLKKKNETRNTLIMATDISKEILDETTVALLG